MDKLRIHNAMAILALMVSSQIHAEEIDEGTVTINRLPESDLKDRLAALRSLMANGKLDSLAMRSLDNLRAKAEQVASVNQACNSVSINSIPDPRCKEFYLKELPAFEKEYSLVTGNIYMNGLTIAHDIKDRRSQINACVQGMESFLNPDFTPQKLAKLKITIVGLDPIDAKTVRANWRVDESLDYEREELLIERIDSWNSICEKVTHNVNGSWNEFFLSQSKDHFSRSSFVPDGNKIYYKDSWYHEALLNGKTLTKEKNPGSIGVYFDLFQRTRGHHESPSTLHAIQWDWNATKGGSFTLDVGDSLCAVSKSYIDNSVWNDLKEDISEQSQKAKHSPNSTSNTVSKKVKEDRTNAVDGINWTKWIGSGVLIGIIALATFQHH